MGSERETDETDAAWGDEPERPRKRRLGLGIGIGIGVGLTLLCGIGVVLLIFFGMGMVTAQVADDLRANEPLRQRIGEVREFELDWGESMSEADEEVFVYRVEGSAGTGMVRVESLTVGDREEVVWAELELPNGEVVELVAREEREE